MPISFLMPQVHILAQKSVKIRNHYRLFCPQKSIPHQSSLYTVHTWWSNPSGKNLVSVDACSSPFTTLPGHRDEVHFPVSRLHQRVSLHQRALQSWVAIASTAWGPKCRRVIGLGRRSIHLVLILSAIASECELRAKLYNLLFSSSRSMGKNQNRSH